MMHFRAPDLPKLTETDRAIIARGEKFAQLQGQEVYQEYIQALYDRFFQLVMELTGAQTGEEALRLASSIGELLKVTQLAGEHATAGSELRAAFEARYEQVARDQQQARRDAQRRGMHARGASVPTT